MPSSKGLRMAPGVAEGPTAQRAAAPSPSLARILSWEIVWPAMAKCAASQPADRTQLSKSRRALSRRPALRMMLRKVYGLSRLARGTVAGRSPSLSTMSLPCRTT